MTGSPFPPQHVTDQAGHGRHDVRVVRAAPAPQAIKDRWPGAEQIFLIERYRHPRTKAMGDISACPARRAGPADLLTFNRRHWGIENGLHHRRDTTYGEDASTVRAGTAPRLLAAINNLVISVLARAGHDNNASARRDLGWDRTGGLRALDLLGLLPK